MTELHDPYPSSLDDELSRLYLAMLRLPSADLSALVAAGFSADAVRRGAAALEHRELIDVAGVDAWEVRPPDVAMNQLARSYESRARLVRASAAEMGAIWRQTRTEQPGTEVVPGMEPLHSADEVVRAIHGVYAAASTGITLMLDDSPATHRWLASQEAGEASQLQDLDIRLVVDSMLLGERDLFAELERRADAGQEVRVGANVPFGVVVADHGSAVVDLSSYSESAAGSFVVRRGPALPALTALVGVAHSLAAPLRPSTLAMQSTPEQAPVDERDRRILGLLATGASDQLIARQVGVSTRTVERRVRSLMERLSAATRFQAGVMAVRREWI